MFSALMIPMRRYSLYVFPMFLFLVIIDGGTQLLRIRESNNPLRFFTGLGFGLTLLPFAVHVGGIIYGKI
jgi:uncharacterized membrane protein